MIFPGGDSADSPEALALKAYPGHCGRPGHVGGSRPKSECGDGIPDGAAVEFTEDRFSRLRQGQYVGASSRDGMVRVRDLNGKVITVDRSRVKVRNGQDADVHLVDAGLVTRGK